MELVRYADRPDLREIRFETLSSRTFPEYTHHNQSGARFWRRLYDEHPDYQLALVDGEELVAELHSVPMPWEGTLADLPSGWDEGFTRAFESGRPATVLCALAISVRPDRQGAQLSSRMLNAMRRRRGRAACSGCSHRSGRRSSTAIRSSRLSTISNGGARTALISTRGSASTSSSAARSSRPRHDRW